MKKSTEIILSIIVIAVIAVSVYTYRNKAVPPTITVETVQPTPAQLKKDTEVVSVNVTYPIIPGTSQEIAAANAFIRSELEKGVDSFEKDAIESTANSQIDLPTNIKSTITGSPATEENNDRYIAIFMGMEWYLRGAAHPGHTIDTYVYDYKKGKLVAVSDMFKSSSEYLSLLSKLSREDLLAQSKTGDLGYVYQADMVAEGTMPTQDNFLRVLPLKDGLAIYFDEYQVAPYAAGPQQVIIPYAKLQDVIDPDSVIGMYIK